MQFSRIFKKRAEISPSEYRKQNIQDTVKTEKIEYKNNINKKENNKIEIILPENKINTETENYESQGDLTAILAAQIEKAARAAEEERKEKEKNPVPPLWLL